MSRNCFDYCEAHFFSLPVLTLDPLVVYLPHRSSDDQSCSKCFPSQFNMSYRLMRITPVGTDVSRMVVSVGHDWSLYHCRVLSISTMPQPPIHFLIKKCLKEVSKLESIRGKRHVMMQQLIVVMI